MPGRLRTNFRSGNLAEHLGLLLLKGIAAVGDVPRAEDIGLDAVATLLRRDPDGNCYAEDGFVVQVKSASKNSMEYRDYQLKWFLAQSQPMFIGLVSMKDARISLYPTLFANQAVLALHAEQITIRFCKSDGPYPWAGGPANSATVWLGPPLLSWTLAEMDDAKWFASAYDILKRFLGIARREHELLSFGQCSKLVWSTNDKDSIRSSIGIMKGRPDNLHTVADQCRPGLNALLSHAMAMPEERSNSLMMSLLGVVASLRDLGVDIDESTSVLAQMSLLWQGKQAHEAGGKRKATKKTLQPTPRRTLRGTPRR
jgi:hypothetical protein